MCSAQQAAPIARCDELCPLVYLEHPESLAHHGPPSRSKVSQCCPLPIGYERTLAPPLSWRGARRPHFLGASVAFTSPPCVAQGGRPTQGRCPCDPETPAYPKDPRVVEQLAVALPQQALSHSPLVLYCPPWQLIPSAAGAGPTAVGPAVRAPAAAGPGVLDSRAETVSRVRSKVAVFDDGPSRLARSLLPRPLPVARRSS